uniref:ABC transmembrane type-1 domain-containing protein n=1 Tax=Heterorhabditis bacteriophora TaxID=37862 RepID=A0A1I7WUF1_HETBA
MITLALIVDNLGQSVIIHLVLSLIGPFWQSAIRSRVHDVFSKRIYEVPPEYSREIMNDPITFASSSSSPAQ